MNALDRWLFAPAGVTPHGFCLLWQPGLVWLHMLSDGAVGAAYFTIPLALAIFARRRRDLVFRPIFLLFAAFILLCGAGHWFDVLTLWIPAYGAQGVVKAATALVSVLTAVTLWPLLPKALALPAPAALQAANAALRLSEARLRESEARYRLLAEHSNDLIVLKRGIDGRPDYVSPACFAILGYTPEEYLALTFAEKLHPDDLASAAADHERLFAEGGPIVNTHRVRHKAGHAVWIETVFNLVDAGTPDQLIVLTARDVSARRAIELARDASEARYRLVAESTSDAIICLDRDGRRTYASPACLPLFGFTPEAVLADPTAMAIHPDDRPAVATLVDRLMAGESGREMATCRVRHRAGHWVWIEGSLGVAVDGVSGEAASIIWALRDITERHHQAHELRCSNAALERLARHLAQARDQAERANRAKSRFLAGMSHELRTPLNGVLGHAQLLRLEGGLTPAQLARVDSMLSAGNHLLQTIRVVLGMSEIEAGQMQSHPTQVELARLGGLCLDLVRPSAETKGLALACEVAPDAPATIVVDQTRLSQILLNLLGNAVKFTARGSVTLRLGATLDGHGMRAEVADTGPGIPADSRERLFQEFERLDEHAAVEGAGLGLAMSARLAAMMGGSVGVADNPGGGSVFWLELPAATLVAAAPPAVASPSADAAPPAPAARQPADGLRVLVVDDVEMNREIAAAFLRAIGHRPVCVGSGAEAVATVAAARFDVVLMDVRMPGMDGLEATRRIRAAGGRRGRIPVVALTAQAFAEQVEECRRAGMDGHLVKPFTLEGMVEALARVTGSRTGAEEEDEAAASAGEAIGADLPLFDEAAFLRTTALLAPEVVTTYLATITARGEGLLRRIREPGARSPGLPFADADHLAAAAHMLASSAGMFGFERAAGLARDFEHAVQTDADAAPALAGGLAAALEASLSEMRARGRSEAPSGMVLAEP